MPAEKPLLLRACEWQASEGELKSGLSALQFGSKILLLVAFTNLASLAPEVLVQVQPVHITVIRWWFGTAGSRRLPRSRLQRCHVSDLRFLKYARRIRTYSFTGCFHSKRIAFTSRTKICNEKMRLHVMSESAQVRTEDLLCVRQMR